MEDRIPFIIRNYNLEKEIYELGKEGFISLDKGEFKTFLNELPIQLFYPFFSIEIYSKRLGNLCIIKTRKNTCDIAYKQLSIQFAKRVTYIKKLVPNDKIVSLLYDKPKINILETFKSEYSSVGKEDKEGGETILNILIGTILFLYVLTIASIFFMLIYVPIKFFENMNFLSIIFWIWLLILTPVIITVNISHISRGDNIEKKTQTTFNTPILDYYKTTNISSRFINMVFTYGTLFLTLPLLFINLPKIDAYILFVIGCIAIFMHIWVIIAIGYGYYKSKDTKDRILQSLLKYLQEENLTWNKKQYYLLLILEFQKIKPISIGYHSKIYAVLMLLFTIIPLYFP